MSKKLVTLILSLTIFAATFVTPCPSSTDEHWKYPCVTMWRLYAMRRQDVRDTSDRVICDE